MFVQDLSYEMLETIHREVMPFITEDREIRNQLHRASRSLVLNLAEGLGFGRGKRQRNHFEIALGSGRETYACLRVVEVTGLLPSERVAPAKAVTDRVNEMLWSLTR
jgi:four helix bundle protein